MNAIEANQLALKNNTNEENSQFAQIIEIIAKSAKKGEYEVWYYEIIKPDVKIKITELGYTIHPMQFERNETITKISWNL
jgi:hypothetical protein